MQFVYVSAYVSSAHAGARFALHVQRVQDNVMLKVKTTALTEMVNEQASETGRPRTNMGKEHANTFTG